MLTRLTGLVLGLALLITPAFAGEDCQQKGKDGQKCEQGQTCEPSGKDGQCDKSGKDGGDCCDKGAKEGKDCCDKAKDGQGCPPGGKDGCGDCAGKDGERGACEKACAEWNYAEPAQYTRCDQHTCPNDLAMQEGRQPKRWAAGNSNYGLTVRNDGCWPDRVENDRNACRNNWNLGMPVWPW